ncbi:MAG: M12 family metallo-peptidase [Gammaproteobacteria bacterium]|nr:M12 family metallo-peptidase [Gammaproteobacteria bacterium]
MRRLLLGLILAGCTQVTMANQLWQPMAQSAAAKEAQLPAPQQRLFQLKFNQLKQRLANSAQRRAVSQTISLPIAENLSAEYRLQPTRVMAPELAAKFPEIQTFHLLDANNAVAGVADINHRGFHAMVYRDGERLLIDPEVNHRSAHVYRLRKTLERGAGRFSCGTSRDMRSLAARRISMLGSRVAPRAADELRQYRLAVSTTWEYRTEVGGSLADALAAIVTAISRVNQIYERDLGIRFVLVADNEKLIATSSFDGLSNDDAFSLLTENQALIDSRIGNDSYDIGHVFATQSSGLASLGVTCNNPFKAQGATGIPNPIGDPFYIDYVAHEIGHQFNADHTFNGTTSSCGGANREALSAFEPGSGSTIMAYAGICGVENIQGVADALFHAHSITQIDDYVANGTGNSCGEIVAVSNNTNAPTAQAGADRTIPYSTPFRLTGSGSDADADSLSYTWDQMDLGNATNVSSHGTDLGDNPLMRSLLPNASGQRNFPRLSTLISGSLQDQRAEALPTQPRDLNFRLTVRDGLGGVATDDVSLQVDNSAGPFVVTGPTGPGALLGSATVTWNVLNTDDVNSVNCQQVDINLLTFNDDVTPTEFCRDPLVTNTLNDGTEDVTLADLNASHARFEVVCSNQSFFNISQQRLSITGSGGDYASNCESIDGDPRQHASIAVEPLLGSYDLDAFSEASVLAIPDSVSDQLSDGSAGSPTRYYRLDPAPGNYSFDLSWTNPVTPATVNLTLLNAIGQVISTSTNVSATAETLTLDLARTGYYLRVEGDTASLNFDLEVTLNQALSDPDPDPAPTNSSGSSGGGGGSLSLWLICLLSLTMLLKFSRQPAARFATYQEAKRR